MFKESYLRRKKELLDDEEICKENRDLFKEFFDWEEKKLKRVNGLAVLDESCYNTLCTYLTKVKNVNRWFKNKPLKKITEKDIEKVYEALEDGKIKNSKGERFGDLKSYYGKIFKSKLFDLAGKKHLAEEVIQFTRKNTEEVRFFEKETFRKIESVVVNPYHKCVLWLEWDIGENINTLLQLTAGDFYRQINPDTKEPEYMVNLPKSKLKRTRQTRSEITIHKETVEILDIILQGLNPQDKVFKFGYGQAKKLLDRAVKITKAKCIPNGQKVTWKDLRSSMACYLLREDWSIDEINARLGHSPSSKQIDKYVNFLAINRHTPKRKIYQNNLRKVEDELEKTKDMAKLSQDRYTKLISKVEESDKVNSERWTKLLKFLEKNPDLADQMMKRDWKALKEVVQ